MLTDRRTAIAAGAALTTLIATGACSQDADTPAASPTADPAAGPSGLMEVIHVFAGEDINRAKYYDFDPNFLLELEPTVAHFEVIEG